MVDYRGGNSIHLKEKKLWFNVSEISLSEDILGAELKIYQSDNLLFEDPDNEYLVSTYQPTSKGNGLKKCTSTIRTTAAYSGWLSLSIKDCLIAWLKFPEINKGFYLSVTPKHRPTHEIRPENIGLLIDLDDEDKPFLVTFLKATNKIRARRSTHQGKTRFKRSLAFAQSLKAKRSCRLHNLYIDFKGWQDWIIAPDGYEASYCAGECNFPLTAHMNATNYAIIESLMHLHNPLRYPKPCCAPANYAPTSVLYFLDDKKAALKKYNNMVVTRCGCQ